MTDVRLIPFDKEFLPAYVALNREWIETHFEIEEMDVRQLEDPYTHILEPGGEIFFLLENGVAVGTCAMVPHGEGCFELAKMAVAKESRGKGYGQILMRIVTEWARAQDAEKVILLSNTVLEPAINLYKANGFVTTHLGPHPDYKRANIVMELDLK